MADLVCCRFDRRRDGSFTHPATAKRIERALNAAGP